MTPTFKTADRYRNVSQASVNFHFFALIMSLSYRTQKIPYQHFQHQLHLLNIRLSDLNINRKKSHFLYAFGGVFFVNRKAHSQYAYNVREVIVSKSGLQLGREIRVFV